MSTQDNQEILKYVIHRGFWKYKKEHFSNSNSNSISAVDKQKKAK